MTLRSPFDAVGVISLSILGLLEQNDRFRAAGERRTRGPFDPGVSAALDGLADNSRQALELLAEIAEARPA